MSEHIQSSVPPAQGRAEDPLAHYTRIFAKFLQLVFATFDRGSGNPQWLPDEQNTEILISDQASYAKEVAEKRPAILVKRGQAASGNISMGQFQNSNSLTGAQSYTDLMSCSMVYRCIAKEGLEAQRIAWVCAMATRRLKKSLMRGGKIHRVGEDISIGEETDAGSMIQPESENEFTLVPVFVPFYFQDFWTVEPVDKLLLKELTLDVTSEASSITPAVRPPMMNGEVLQVTNAFSLNSRVKVTRLTTPKPRK